MWLQALILLRLLKDASLVLIPESEEEAHRTQEHFRQVDQLDERVGLQVRIGDILDNLVRSAMPLVKRNGQMKKMLKS